MAEPDQKLETFIAVYKDAVDRKYNPIVGRLTRKLVHSNREEERNWITWLPMRFTTTVNGG